MNPKNNSSVDTSNILELIKTFGDKLCDDLFDPVSQELALYLKLLKETDSLKNSELKFQEDAVTIFKGYNSQLSEFVSTAFIRADQIALKDRIREYVRELETIIADLPKEVTLLQEDQRFIVSKADSFKIKIYKGVKSTIKKIQRFGLPLVNFIRRIVRKSQIDMPVWKHTVAVRQVFRYTFRNLFLKDLAPHIFSALSRTNEIHAMLANQDGELSHSFFNVHAGQTEHSEIREILINFNSLVVEFQAELENLRNTFRQEILQTGERNLQQYQLFEKISGTSEYPHSKSAVRLINRRYSNFLSEFHMNIHQYGNARYFIFEDQRFDLALNELSIFLLSEYYELLSIYNTKYKNDLQAFEVAYSNLLINLKASPLDRGHFTIALSNTLRGFKSGFASLLIRSMSLLKSHNLPKRLRNISRTFASKVNAFSETRVFVKKFGPDRMVSDKELINIRPADILRFEHVPELNMDVEKLLATTENRLETLYTQLEEIGTIAEFSIESALQEAKDANENVSDPEKTLQEGLLRSKEKLQGLEKIYKEIKTVFEEELNAILQNHVIDIQLLRENDRILSLNMKLVRAWLKRRANERKKLVLKKTRQLLKGLFIGPLALIKNGLSHGKKVYSKVISTSSPEAISAELSAYLGESKNAQARLPYIYQRLYMIEPLTEELFYLKRKREASQVNDAIANWENKRYSPVVLIGEKGSGTTTFINQYRREITKYKTVQIGSTKQIFTRADFLGFLADSLHLKSKELQGILEELNAGEEQVIFLEDIQNLYLRTVEGFAALKSFFTIMSLTNEKILWITSCAKYAWNYLELTLTISSYFNSLIHLDELDSEQIKELILKRHGISGYSIKYFPNKLQEKSRLYRKIPSDKKQQYLEDRYFSNMNDFAKGNISLSLHFWLRSTIEVQEKDIVMSSIYDIDYSFLNTLKTDHLIVLTMISIHDGINANTLALITRKTAEESERVLNQLFDDSIVVKRNDNYLINPLLYRQVVEFLKNKNFIQ